MQSYYDKTLNRKITFKTPLFKNIVSFKKHGGNVYENLYSPLNSKYKIRFMLSIHHLYINATNILRKMLLNQKQNFNDYIKIHDTPNHFENISDDKLQQYVSSLYKLLDTNKQMTLLIHDADNFEKKEFLTMLYSYIEPGNQKIFRSKSEIINLFNDSGMIISCDSPRDIMTLNPLYYAVLRIEKVE